ncbi:MAG: bacillithiol biosynthesis deacetylase BshB1 [Candidatus Heimdallarchaeota archaeon]
MLDVLVFAPHPDDAELGAGGAIVKAISAGFKVGIIDLTAGEMGSLGTKESRLGEAEAARKILGAELRQNLGFPDAFLPFEDKKKVVLKIADKIREFKPTIILMPYWEDRHPDHVTTSVVVSKACHFAKLKKIKLNHPKHKVKHLLYYELNNQSKFTFIMDISNEFKKKKEAIMTFKSQFKEFSMEYLPFPVEERCKHYGSLIKKEYGEAFYMKDPLVLKDWTTLID